MYERGADRVMQMLLVLGVIVGAVFVFRVRGIDVTATTGGTSLNRAMKTYQDRIRSTEQVLKTDRL